MTKEGILKISFFEDNKEVTTLIENKVFGEKAIA
jgi:hypothetical protein